MDVTALILWLIIGGLAGWLASVIIKGAGQGLVMNIAVGIAGALIGGWLFGVLNIGAGTGFVGSLVTATIGAILLLALLRLLAKGD